MADETNNDSSRTESEKQNAVVRATAGPDNDPEAFLVEYPDGSFEHEPATPKNQALFGEGLFSEIEGTTAYDYQGTPVELEADIEREDYTITVDGNSIRVPSDRDDDVVDAFRTAFTGERLHDLYHEIIEGQVRRSVIERFEDRFPTERIEQTADGWVVDDTFIVTYEAKNHLVSVDPTDPYGNSVDESKQAVYLDINASGERTIPDPDGDDVTLTELEQEFLTTVEGLLYPNDYFGVDLVDEIEQHKAESESLSDVFEDLAGDADVKGFTDSKTGIHHGSRNHSFQKHDVRDLNVTEEVRDKLWSNPYDHASVSELLLRRTEFENNPDIDIFTDQPDDSEWKWEEIESTSENAPIPPKVRNKLDSMFK